MVTVLEDCTTKEQRFYGQKDSMHKEMLPVYGGVPPVKQFTAW
jgi:hypothetical protein